MIVNLIAGLPPVHPGEHIRCDFIPEITLEEFQRMAEIDGIWAVVAEQAPITPTIAAALSALGWASAEFWLNLQAHYDEKIAAKA